MTALPRFFSASLLLGAILFAAQAATAAEPLVWKWAEGDTARYQLTQEMRMSMNAGPAGKIETAAQNVTAMRWTAAQAADGATSLVQQVERIVMETNGPMGQSFRFDTASGEPPAGMATLVAPVFQALCEHPYTVTMQASGEITEVKLSDELTTAFDKLPGGAMSSEKVTQMSKQGSLRFPEGPLEVGDTWESDTQINNSPVGAMKFTTTYTYRGPKSVDGRELEAIDAEIAVEAVPAANQQMQVEFNTKESSGQFLFDRKAGRLVSSGLTQVIEMQIQAPGQEITNVMTQNVRMRVLAEGEELDLPEAEPAEAEAAESAE